MTARPTTRSLLAALTAVLAGLALGACDKPEKTTEGETEGVYLDVGQMTYQVQMSRQLNPAAAEDRDYLRGVDAAEADLAADQVWFGVFVRAQNEFDEPGQTASEFEISDTLENHYEPVPIANVYAYEPETLPEGALLPDPDSTAGNGPTQGALLLFKLPRTALSNRPLKFHISELGDEGEVDLDI